MISKFLPFLNIGDNLIALLLLIDAKIYGFIAKLYSFYLDLAKAKIFNSAMFQDISNKIYLLMGVVALFILVYTLIQSIVNPDGIAKNGADIVKRFAIAIVMIVLTPAIFNFLYTAQDAILSDNIIQKLILRSSDSNNEITVEYTDQNGKYIFTDDCNASSYDEALKTCKKATGKLEDKASMTLKSYGNEMGWIVLNAFLYPNDGVPNSEIVVDASKHFGIDTGVKLAAIGCAVGGTIATVVIVATEIYTSPATGFATLSAVPGTIAAFGGTIAASCGAGILAGTAITGAGYLITYDEYKFSDAETAIRTTGDFDMITPFGTAVNDGRMNYTPIVSTICGLILAYMLLSFCIDLGLRAAKLAFYQLMAPISMLLYTLPNQKSLLSKWFKAVLTTWAEVFIRIFTMCSVAYLISNLNNAELEGIGLLAKAVIVIGLVTFAKQFPKLLSEVTGIDSGNMKLGIMDKLNAGTFGFAGGVLGGATGAIGGAIAAKRYGGSFFAGLATGAVSGYQGKGNQWKKQANKQYSALTGDHKGKVGYFGGKTMTTRINNRMSDVDKRSKNAAQVDRTQRIYENKKALEELEKVWANTNVEEKTRIAEFEATPEFKQVYDHVANDANVNSRIKNEQRKWDIDNVNASDEKRAQAYKDINDRLLKEETIGYMKKHYTQNGPGYVDYKTDNNRTAMYLRDVEKNSLDEKRMYTAKKEQIEKRIKKDESIDKALGKQKENDEWVKNMREMLKQTGLDKELGKDDKKK